MDRAVKSVIRSYTEVIVTVVLIVLIGLLVYRSLKYIRAVWKRMNLMQRLKKVCREQNLILTVEKSPVLSVFRPTSEPELTIRMPERTYFVKLTAFVNPARTYLLNGPDRIFVDDNFRMNVLSLRSKMHPGQSPLIRKTIRLRAIYPIDSGGGMRELTKPDNHVNFKSADPSENILCIHPTSQEMLKVEGSRTVPLFDGDVLENCTVYSGSALLNLLKHGT